MCTLTDNVDVILLRAGHTTPSANFGAVVALCLCSAQLMSDVYTQSFTHTIVRWGRPRSAIGSSSHFTLVRDNATLVAPLCRHEGRKRREQAVSIAASTISSNATVGNAHREKLRENSVAVVYFH